LPEKIQSFSTVRNPLQPEISGYFIEPQLAAVDKLRDHPQRSE
jgi:hypothetical protein